MKWLDENLNHSMHSTDIGHSAAPSKAFNIFKRRQILKNCMFVD